MIGADELVRRFAELDRAELARWIERRWIVPETQREIDREIWLFHEVDVARVELILDIRREFTVDEETLSLVLGLLDQVYSLRRQMRRLCGAIESQPSEIREAIRDALRPRRSRRAIGLPGNYRRSLPPCGNGKRRWKLMSQLGWSIQGGSGGKRPTAATIFMTRASMSG